MILEYQPTGRHPAQPILRSGLSLAPTPSRSDLLLGLLYGALAALGWAVGFVGAKHGIEIGFHPADLIVHRFAWSGLVTLPFLMRAGLRDLAGVGWLRGITLMMFAGPPQSLLAYSGFILVPLGHGTVIQPSTATLSGLLMASLFLGERLSPWRIAGALIIVAGLIVFGIEAIATIGSHGIGGDLLFVGAGLSWAVFGTLLRHWRVPGLQGALVVGLLSALLFAPAYLLMGGYQHLIALGWEENLIQAVIQGGCAGLAPIYLFGRAVVLLGAGRAGTFAALVPCFSLLIGYLALGTAPSMAQLAGLVIVMIGFQFVVRR